jgi:hypothetical protein
VIHTALRASSLLAVALAAALLCEVRRLRALERFLESILGGGRDLPAIHVGDRPGPRPAGSVERDALSCSQLRARTPSDGFSEACREDTERELPEAPF